MQATTLLLLLATRVFAFADGAAVTVRFDQVAKRDAVQLAGVGTFKASTRAAREGRNPQTGATLKIPETTLPKVTAGLAFKKQVAEVGQESKVGATHDSKS